jgi:hypothetical protein
MLKADLSELPGGGILEKAGANGEKFYIDFDIEMTIYSANISFALVFAGKRYRALQFDFS